MFSREFGNKLTINNMNTKKRKFGGESKKGSTSVADVLEKKSTFIGSNGVIIAEGENRMEVLRKVRNK